MRCAARGVDPYPVRFDRTHTSAEVLEHWGQIEAGMRDRATSCASPAGSCCCGAMGKLTFATLRDGAGDDPAVRRPRLTSATRPYAAFDDLDLGDWVGAEGTRDEDEEGRAVGQGA